MADPDGDKHAGPQPAASRLDAPAYHRNIAPITAVFEKLLPSQPADILEIGSGTGQHITALARTFSDHRWWPSDLASEHLASTRAWIADIGVDNVGPPIRLDASMPEWDFGGPGHPPQRLHFMFSANVIHISPWPTATGLLAGAGRHLLPTGQLLLYGPFSTDGHHTAPSNEAFDQSLRRQDPAWGIRDTRDLEAVGEREGLVLAEKIAMPANNFILRFERS